MSIQSSAWDALVVPTETTRKSSGTDSTELRITVMPTWADIYIDGNKVGSGRKFLTLPVGMHTILFHATGCKDVTTNVAIFKGPPIVVPTVTLECKSEPELS
jgi:hypothetical protein